MAADREGTCRVWGLPYLAQISRWHDRDKADLELTLPSALTFLVRDGLILPEDAISALGLVDPIEMWIGAGTISSHRYST